jgi:hypothetical protein
MQEADCLICPGGLPGFATGFFSSPAGEAPSTGTTAPVIRLAASEAGTAQHLQLRAPVQSDLLACHAAMH